MSGTLARLGGTDVAVRWDRVNGRGDWAMQGADLATDQPLVTAVLISLFTDRVASPDFVNTDGTADRRGWWGDAFNPRPIGSRLWQFERAKKVGPFAMLLEVRDAIRDALNWVVEDGIASGVDVSNRWTTPSVMAVQVTIRKPAAPSTSLAFQWVWKGVA